MRSLSGWDETTSLDEVVLDDVDDRDDWHPLPLRLHPRQLSGDAPLGNDGGGELGIRSLLEHPEASGAFWRELSTRVSARSRVASIGPKPRSRARRGLPRAA